MAAAGQLEYNVIPDFRLKLQVTNSSRPAAAILNFGRLIGFWSRNKKTSISEFDTHMVVVFCANFVAFIQKCRPTMRLSDHI